MPEEVADVDFAFAVIKDKKGNLNIGTIDNPALKQEKQPSIDDIFVALTLILKDMERQQLVGAFLQGMQKVMQPQDSKLVVPQPSAKFEKIVRK